MSSEIVSRDNFRGTNLYKRKYFHLSEISVSNPEYYVIALARWCGWTDVWTSPLTSQLYSPRLHFLDWSLRTVHVIERLSEGSGRGGGEVILILARLWSRNWWPSASCGDGGRNVGIGCEARNQWLGRRPGCCYHASTTTTRDSNHPARTNNVSQRLTNLTFDKETQVMII